MFKFLGKFLSPGEIEALEQEIAEDARAKRKQVTPPRRSAYRPRPFASTSSTG